MLTESKPDADSWIEAQGKKVYGMVGDLHKSYRKLQRAEHCDVL